MWLDRLQLTRHEAVLLGAAMCVAVALAFFTAHFPWYISLALIIAAGIGIFVLRQPFFGLLLLIFFLPFERLGTYELGGTTIRISQLLLIVLIGALFLKLFWRRIYLTIYNPLLIPLLLFLAAVVFSLANTPNLHRSVTVFIFTVFTMSLAVLVPLLVTDATRVKKVVIVLLVSFVIVCAFGMFQFVGDMIGLPSSVTGLRDLYTKEVLGFTRVQSTAYEPLYFGNYLLIPLSIVFALFLSGRRMWRASWHIVLFGLGMVCLVLTVARGAYIAAIAALGIVGLFYLRKVLTFRNIMLFLVIVLAVGWVVVKTLGVGGGLLTMEKFQEHISNIFYGASYNERIDTFGGAVTAWREHPLIGIGIGGFGPSVATHPYTMPKDGWKIVNNEFLEILAETGVVGLFFFVVFIVFLLVRSLKAIFMAQDDYVRALLIGSSGAFIGVLVQYQTFSTLYIMHVWFLIGLIIALQNMVYSESRKTR